MVYDERGLAWDTVFTVPPNFVDESLLSIDSILLQFFYLPILGIFGMPPPMLGMPPPIPPIACIILAICAISIPPILGMPPPILGIPPGMPPIPGGIPPPIAPISASIPGLGQIAE
mmetsp:Transcript_46397/g.112474  ORF Transcript_46397/g.112474 Transcript_46397/m.112474 type:complete len:116 (+) Transcript_46397:350-697(+)